MNSRQRRKKAAQEHNERIELMQELRAIQSAICAKHGVQVRAVIDQRNFSLVREIERLRGILEADARPKPVKVASVSPFLAAMAALGVEAGKVVVGAKR